jgi:amino acid transporter
MAAPREEKRAYRRSLGLLELVSLGVGATIGSGIFVVPGIAAGLAGPSSLLAWIVVAASATCVALSLARIQACSPSGTTFTAIFTPLFGRAVSAVLVGLYLLSCVLGVATIAAGLGQYFSFFAIPHVLSAEILVLAIFLGVNIIGIGLSGQTENVLTAIKVVSLVVLAVALAPSVRVENLVLDEVASLPDLLKVAIIVYWPFTGFEISAIPVEETRDPRRIARALVVVMALVCSIYMALNLSLIGAVGSAALASSSAPVAYAAGHVFAGAAPYVAMIGIVTMLSALNAYIVGASRVLQNVAAAYRMPWFAVLSRRGVPAAALAATCGFSAVLLLFSNRFDTLAAASVVANLGPYVAICAAAFVLAKEVSARAVAFGGMILTAAILVLYALL